MKNKTKTGKILQSIWQIFKDLFPSFIDKTYNKIEPEIRQEISLITQIVSKVNDFVQSPLSNVLTDLIPVQADDKFVNWLKLNLPKYLDLKDKLDGGQKALISAKITQDRTGMPLSQSLITSQVVYQKENS